MAIKLEKALAPGRSASWVAPTRQNLLTVTASSEMFSVDDVASVLRINGATTTKFNGSFQLCPMFRRQLS